MIEVWKYVVGCEPYVVVTRSGLDDNLQDVDGAFRLGVYALWLKTRDSRIPEQLSAGMVQALEVDPDRNRAIVCVCNWVWNYFYEKRPDHHQFFRGMFEWDLTAVVAAVKPMIVERESELRADKRWFGATWNSDTGLWGPLIRQLVGIRDTLGGPDLVPACAEPLLKKAR